MKSFIKKYLISGMLVLVPVVFTIWILRVLIFWMDDFALSFLPYQLRPKELFGYNIPGIGLLLTFLLILGTGFLTRLYIGKKLIQIGDSFFSRLPFGRAIYQAIKQVMHVAVGEKDRKKRKVALVEYPQAGTYALGFVTGTCDTKTWPGNNGERIMVFVPTAPNPTSGFLLIVDQKSIIETDLTPEEASKLLISGGLLAKRVE